MTADLRPAATVLVLRDGPSAPEVLMVRRHDKAAFMAGAHVFPGGAVDAVDSETADARWCSGLDHAASQLPDLAPAEAASYHVAAIRELFEEAGVLLARDESGRLAAISDPTTQARFSLHRLDIHAGRRALRDMLQQEHLRMAADELTVCAHWVTPRANSRRFDTRFFLTRLPDGQQPAHDEHETTESLWTTARGAIASAERGDIVLPPPTWVMLLELEPFQSAADAVAGFRGRRIERREPESVEEQGGRIIVMPADSPGTDSRVGTTRWTTRFVWSDGRWRPEEIK